MEYLNIRSRVAAKFSRGGRSNGSMGRFGRSLPQRIRMVENEAQKLWRFGFGFPRAMEEIFVETRAVRRAIADPLELAETPSFEQSKRNYRAARNARGRVIDDEEFNSFSPVDLLDLVKVRCCVEHWGNGIPWETTGIFDHMLRKIARTGVPQSGCLTIDDLRRRYDRLDRVFRDVAREGRLRSARELGERPGFWSRRGNWNGVEIHLGTHGEPIFGDAGNHRLAMAKVLELERIPALVGFVHVSAVGKLPRFRDSAVRTISMFPYICAAGAV